MSSGDGFNHSIGVDNIGWDAVGVIGGGLDSQVLPRGGSWRVNVATRGGILLD